MGNQPGVAEPPIASIQYSPEVDDQRREDDFWYSIVELTSPFLPSDVVFAWDKDAVRRIVLEISNLDVDSFRDFRAASSVLLPEAQRSKLRFPDSAAAKMLKLDSRLSKLRFRLVPARIKEAVFWEQYFEQIVLRIAKYVCGEAVPMLPIEDLPPSTSADHSLTMGGPPSQSMSSESRAAPAPVASPAPASASVPSSVPGSAVLSSAPQEDSSKQ